MLNLITHRSFIVQVRALQFRRRRHHCLCVPQLNNVQAFVHVLVGRLHCETSAFSFVYTLVLESQVHHRYAQVECFSSLDHDHLRDLHPEFLECRWLGTFLEGRQREIPRVSFDSCTKRQHPSLPRLKPMCSVSIPARNSVKSRLGVRMPFIAPCRVQVQPSRSCPFGGRTYVSEEVSACMNAHKVSSFDSKVEPHCVQQKCTH